MHWAVTPIHSSVVEANVIACVLICALALVSPGVTAQSAVETPRTIRVVMDNAYAPDAFQSDKGELQGVLIDQWRAWERETGIKVEIHAMDWSEALRRMRAGGFDVIDCIVETDERRDWLDFTPPRRIATMLHETTAQDLAALKMLLARLGRTADRLSDGERDALTESISLADRGVRSLLESK